MKPKIPPPAGGDPPEPEDDRASRAPSDAGLAVSGDGAGVQPLLRRKSVLMVMAASMGFVFAKATEPSGFNTEDATRVPKWAPSTAYALGQQVISPTNEIVSAKVAHTSSAAYATDKVKWTLSSTYASVISVPAGSTAAQINAAIAGAPDDSTVQLYGTYALSSPIIVTSHLDASAATIHYTGTGVAVQVGAGGAGVLILAKSIQLPKVVNLAKTRRGWAQVEGSVGVRVINANACQIVVPYVTNFETSLEMRGEAAGNVLNVITLGRLSNSKIGQRFTADADGWVNQNTFIGGQIDMESDEGDRVAGTRYILMDNTPSAVNGNTWLGTSLEGNGPEYSIECPGVDNLWIGCRFESSLGSRVWWRAPATRNAILQGYAAPVIMNEAGASLNDVSQTGRSRNLSVSSLSGVFNLQNNSPGAHPVLTIMSADTPLEEGNHPATRYALAASALGWKGKRPADVNDRVIVDANNGRIAFGDGAAPPAAALGFYTAGMLRVEGASLLPSSDNTKDLGVGTYRWRYVRAGTAVCTGSFTTATRPGAAEIGRGAMVFDTTLNKPIWSNGTNWVDATGMSV